MIGLPASIPRQSGTVRNPAKPPRILVSADAAGRVSRSPLLPAYSDEFSIIATLQQLVDDYGRNPEIRKFAVSLLNSRNNNDVETHFNTLLSWVKAKVIYLADPDGAELLHSPFYLIRKILGQGYVYGDCDDHVLLLGSLAVSIGIPCKAVGVKLPGATWFNHVIISALIYGKWQDVDPCAKSGQSPVYLERLSG